MRGSVLLTSGSCIAYTVFVAIRKFYTANAVLLTFWILGFGLSLTGTVSADQGVPASQSPAAKAPAPKPGTSSRPVGIANTTTSQDSSEEADDIFDEVYGSDEHDQPLIQQLNTSIAEDGRGVPESPQEQAKTELCQTGG